MGVILHHPGPLPSESNRGETWVLPMARASLQGWKRSLHWWWPQHVPPGLPWVAWASSEVAHLHSSLPYEHDRCWVVERTTEAAFTAYLISQTWSVRSPLPILSQLAVVSRSLQTAVSPCWWVPARLMLHSPPCL